MKKVSQHVKTTLMVFFCLLIMVPLYGGHADAATVTQVSAAVNKAESAAKVLKSLSTIGAPGAKGDPKKRPVNELNAARTARDSAQKLVTSLSASKKKPYAARLKIVNDTINNGQIYINAINGGEKLDAKKRYLNKQENNTTIMVKAYKDLNTEIRNQGLLLNKVSGKSTKDSLKEYYVKPAEKIRDEFRAAVDVKVALMRIPTGSTTVKLDAAKKVLLTVHTITRPQVEKALLTEWRSVKGKVTKKDDELKNLIQLDQNLYDLSLLVSPGVSNAKVPGLHQSIEDEIDLIPNDEDQWAYTQTLENTMKRLFLDVKTIKMRITQKAIERGIPPEIAKAIAYRESVFKQFEEDGEAYTSNDYGYGVMQVTQQNDADVSQNWDEIKYDINKNIEAGLNILLDKWDHGKRIPTINNHEMDVLEDWYFAIMAYNGLSLKNIPGGNRTPYQLQVYGIMKDFGLMDPEMINIADSDYSYNADSGQVTFIKMQYTTSKKTKSNLLGKEGDVITTGNPVTFRTKPSTDREWKVKDLNPGSKFTILSAPSEDPSKSNLFSWYKVKLPTGEQGYVASIW